MSIVNQTGIIESYWTPGAAKNAIWALTHLAPQEVEDMLLQFGKMNPSRSSLDRLLKALNHGGEPEYSAPGGINCGGKNSIGCSQFSVSLDGVMIGMKPEKSGTDDKVPGKQNGVKQAVAGLAFLMPKVNV